MGTCFSNLFGKQPTKILILGLHDSGKTTITYQMKLQQVVDTTPTIGFNVETFTVGKIEFVMWDAAMHEKMRALFRHYYPGTKGIVYVVDAADEELLYESKEEFSRFLAQEQLSDVVVMILANKMDKSNALPPHIIQEKLGVVSLIGKRKWRLFSVSALERTQLSKAFEWFAASF